MEFFELWDIVHKQGGFLSATTVFAVMEVGLQDMDLLKEGDPSWYQPEVAAQRVLNGKVFTMRLEAAARSATEEALLETECPGHGSPFHMVARNERTPLMDQR